jgi:hypothetical protein
MSVALYIYRDPLSLKHLPVSGGTRFSVRHVSGDTCPMGPIFFPGIFGEGPALVPEVPSTVRIYDGPPCGHGGA